MSGHSPAPWQPVYSDEDENWVVLRADVANPAVAIVGTEADARLIAAAPELLAVARAAAAQHADLALRDAARALLERLPPAEQAV